MDEVRVDWKRQLIEELYNLYSSQNTIGVIKSRRMRWAVHIAYSIREVNTVHIA